MAGKLFYKALSVLVVIASVVLYVLGILLPDTLGFFDIKACLLILVLGLGVVALLKAVTSKANIFLMIAAVLITGGLIFAGISYSFLPADKTWLYIPIGIAILLVFIFFRYLFNIRKWDAGDNEKLGYKNYKQRQAEKEKDDIEESIKELEKEVREREKEKALLMMDIEDKRKQKDSIKKKK